MSDVIDSDGFRSNVGIVLMHRDEVFLGRRTVGRRWQFPQGGGRPGVAAEPEFDRWRWVPYWEPVREVIYFKRPVYARALEELSSLAFPQGRPALPAWWDKVTARGGHRVASAPAH